MEESRGSRLRKLPHVLAALAIGDIAYRLLAREPLRRALALPDIDVKIQEEFKPQGNDTLSMLVGYRALRRSRAFHRRHERGCAAGFLRAGTARALPKS